MSYIAWSDGSYSEGKGAFAGFIIKNENEEMVIKRNYKINDIKSSYETEVAALYLLLKEIEKRSLSDVEIFIDEKGLSKKIKNKGSHIHFGLKENFDSKFFERAVLNVQWGSREYNLAHNVTKEIPCAILHHFYDDFTMLKKIHMDKQAKRRRVLERRRLRKAMTSS